MSLLGFDAVGRWSLGQLPNNSNFVLLAAQSSIALAGQSVAFATSEVAATAGFLEGGISAGFKVTQPGNPGSFAFAGNAAAFGFRQASLGGSVLLNSLAVISTVRTAVSTGAIIVTGEAVPFFASVASGPGAFAWAGGSSAPNRDHEAWVRRPFDSMSWQLEATLPPSTWSGAATAAGVWTADLQPSIAWTPALIEPEPWTTE